MNAQRQQAFVRLKAPCVHLSSVALKFRTKTCSVKDVLRALEAVRDVLTDLGNANQLDPKLAEYAFFPLAQQIFNEAKRLSSRCLEVAIDCVTLLVDHGYRQALLPELGKQLLILMSMLAGAGPNAQTEPATDELKVTAFKCLSSVIKALASSKDSSNIFEDQGTRNVIDQLTYLLLESITDSPSDTVQISATEALLQLISAIKNRVFLASLLPRTVSSLVRALKSSTKARRTQKVLITNLKVLQHVLQRTVSDRAAINPTNEDEKDTLGESWLRATSSQIKNALIQVCKLREHDSAAIRRALEELCVMVIEECQQTLTDSVSVAFETLIVLSALPEAESAQATCRYLVTAYPETVEMLRSSFMRWSQSLPRLMQGQDERPKKLALQKLTATLPLLAQTTRGAAAIDEDLVPLLITSVSNMMEDITGKTLELHNGDASIDSLLHINGVRHREFGKFLLSHEAQGDTTAQLQKLLLELRQSPQQTQLIRHLVNAVAEMDGISRLASTWLALQLLRESPDQGFFVEDFLMESTTSDFIGSRQALLADLHAATFPLLSTVFEADEASPYHWQLQALALEALVLHAQTFPKDFYRPELADTLYPVLSFLASPNAVLHAHAMTALNCLATTCQYSSTQDLLIHNVDYLVNSISWKLNTYSLSPEAPQLLTMMVQLCGAELIPYLDDLIQSIFAALDNYHGYPEWVEALFTALKSIVNVSVKQPQLTITQGIDPPSSHKNLAIKISSRLDILNDLQARKRRKRDFNRSATEPPTSAPQRPWTTALDGPSFPKSVEDLNESNVDDSNEQLTPTEPAQDDDKKSLTKPHTLLLSIATSTVPHLASPSPRVRHLLLDLLKDISPLLSRDEDSFLPLVNAVWPVVVPRLFAESDAKGDGDGDPERAYNVAAAGDTIAALCVSAGDFMAGRIEDIFGQLVRLFRRVRGQVDLGEAVAGDEGVGFGEKANARDMSYAEDAGSSIAGTVNLQVVAKTPVPDTPTQQTKALSSGLGNRAVSRPSTLRTSALLVFRALIDLLLAILEHVHLSLDTSDEIMRLLLPLMEYKGEIREVLEVYNTDAVWFWETSRDMREAGERERYELAQRQVDEAEEGEGDRVGLQRPVLRPALRDLGFELMPLRSKS